MVYTVVDDLTRSQYQKLGNVEPRRKLAMLTGFMIITLSVVFLAISAWTFSHSKSRRPSIHTIYLDLRKPLVHTVSDKFLSFGLDSSLLRNTDQLPILNETFTILAGHLAPAFVRVGGTSADCLYFNQVRLLQK